jgi:predicted dehydrogenase
MDILYWLADSSCESLYSYGDLRYFKKENAPPGSPPRCLDGCPHMVECPWFAPKIYLTDNTSWLANVITTDLSHKGRLSALETGPYGRCVFRCDNDVVDHQTVSMRFTNGVTANFIMTGFSMNIHRSIALFGTAGEIWGDMEENTIRLDDFATKNSEIITVDASGGHSGGDENLITDFVRIVRGDSNAKALDGEGRNMIRNSFESHYMAFAAEQSRLEGKPIRLEGFKRN